MTPPPTRPPAERARRATAYARAWIPRLPGDALAARRIRLPGGYRRIYHVHVPKSGGTSLNRAFMALGGEDPAVVHHRVLPDDPRATRSGPYVFVAADSRATAWGQWFFAFSHTPRWQLRLPPATFTVTVLRDPLARVVSLYRYLADDEGDLGMPLGARRWREDAQQGFGSFVDSLHPRNLKKQLNMFDPDMDPARAADAVRRTDLWFFTESYGRGLAALNTRLRLSLGERTDRVSTTAWAPEPEDLARLRQLLEPEYELLERLRRDPGPGLAGDVPRAD